METIYVQYIAFGIGGMLIMLILKEIVKIIREMAFLVETIIKMTAEVYQATHVPDFVPDFDTKKDGQVEA